MLLWKLSWIFGFDWKIFYVLYLGILLNFVTFFTFVERCSLDENQLSTDNIWSLFRCSLDLSTLEPEQTHELWLELEDGAGKIFLLVTISGKTYGSDLSDESGSKISEELISKYSLRSSMLSSNFFDVGFLEVKIYCAKGLYAADLVRMKSRSSHSSCNWSGWIL